MYVLLQSAQIRAGDSPLVACYNCLPHVCCCVQVAGGLLSLGDAHAAQGDSELDGTAIETSITAKIRVTLHKNGTLPRLVQVHMQGCVAILF